MRRIPINKTQPGMVLAKPVYNDFGVVLLGKDIELTESIILKMEKLGIESVYINDPRTDDIVVEDVLSDKTKEMALKSIKNTFQDMFKEKLINRPVIKHDLSTIFKPVLEQMLNDIKSNKQAMLMLSTIYIKDFYLYTHSLQVALYAISMGLAKGYNNQNIIELGLGALLHDIGKTMVPLSILDKKGKLDDDEFDLVKKHTSYGFDILRKEHGIPLLSAHCAYQHHERFNGSGYPRGIKGGEIHEYAKIVAISDVYDALTSKRVYRDSILPHEALEYLYTKADIDFDKEWVEVFNKTIAIYPLGVYVSLSSHENGVVVDINSKFPSRPIVRILETEQDGELKKPYEIDLSKDLSKVIVKSY